MVCLGSIFSPNCYFLSHAHHNVLDQIISLWCNMKKSWSFCEKIFYDLCSEFQFPYVKKWKISTSQKNVLIGFLSLKQHSKNIFRDFLPENFSNCSRQKVILCSKNRQFLCIFELLYMFFFEVDTGQHATGLMVCLWSTCCDSQRSATGAY